MNCETFAGTMSDNNDSKRAVVVEKYYKIETQSLLHRVGLCQCLYNIFTICNSVGNKIQKLNFTY